MYADNCRLPQALWRNDYPTQVANCLVEFFGTRRGAAHPDLILSYRNVPPDAPIARLLDELQNTGGFVNHSFQARFGPNGEALPDHTADFRLKTVCTASCDALTAVPTQYPCSISVTLCCLFNLFSCSCCVSNMAGVSNRKCHDVYIVYVCTVNLFGNCHQYSMHK